MSSPTPPAEPNESVVVSAASDSFGPWLGSLGGSLVVSCYQAGKIALLGWNGKTVSVHLRDFPRPMGLAIDGQRLAIGALEEIIVFRNAPQLADDVFADQPTRYDALYLPQTSYRTGEVAVHGLAFAGDELWFVNTRFSCLSTLSPDFNFVPRWKPPFISDLAPEDYCHLNGMAVVDGQPRFVTSLGTTNVPGAWRKDKVTGGVIMSVPDGRIVASGLCMPHSPRWYDRRLWVLNSGHGQLAYVDPQSGALQVVATLPGYLRGLCFQGPYAIVGMCQIRERHIFGGLPISSKFPQLLCGVAVVDLRNGNTIGMFLFTSGCQEVFDVDFLPGVQQPAILNHDHPGMRLAYTAPEGHWYRQEKEATPDANAPEADKPQPGDAERGH
ncbi:MAG: TIGR03032 family protein [Planctomycetota bacterium]|nr:MAG: TIGR03032 family protein [Planctomycetota bacterium]